MREQRTDKSVEAEVELLMAFCKRYPLKWIVVYSNVNCERRAFRGLMAKGIFAWLPERLVERKQGRSNKKYTVRKPLFSRYILVGLDTNLGQTVDDVLACDGVEGIVKITQNGTAHALTADEVARVMAELSKQPDIKDGTIIMIGDVLGIIVGPFSGNELKVTAYEEGSSRVTGDVSVLGGKTSVEIDVDHLKKSA